MFREGEQCLSARQCSTGISSHPSYARSNFLRPRIKLEVVIIAAAPPPGSCGSHGGQMSKGGAKGGGGDGGAMECESCVVVAWMERGVGASVDGIRNGCGPLERASGIGVLSAVDCDTAGRSERRRIIGDGEERGVVDTERARRASLKSLQVSAINHAQGTWGNISSLFLFIFSHVSICHT